MSLKQHIAKMLSELAEDGESADWIVKRDTELFIQAIKSSGGDLQLIANIESTKESDIEKIEIMRKSLEALGWTRADGLMSRRFDVSIPIDETATFIATTLADTFGVSRSNQLSRKSFRSESAGQSKTSRKLTPTEILKPAVIVATFLLVGFLLFGWNTLQGVIQSVLAIVMFAFGGIFAYAIYIHKQQNPPSNILADFVSEWIDKGVHPIAVVFIVAVSGGFGLLMVESAKISFTDWTPGRTSTEISLCESSSEYPYSSMPKKLCWCVVSSLAGETHYGKFQQVKSVVNERRISGRSLNDDEVSRVIKTEKTMRESTSDCLALEALSSTYEAARSIDQAVNQTIDNAIAERRKRELQ